METCPWDRRLGEHRAGDRWRRTSLLTPSASRLEGKGRRWWKKPRYKCGLCRCYGIKRRIRGGSPYRTHAGRDFHEKRNKGLVRKRPVDSVVCTSSRCCVCNPGICDESNEFPLARCDTTAGREPQHSRPLGGDESHSRVRYRDSTKPVVNLSTAVSRPRCKGEHSRFWPLFLLLANVLLVGTNSKPFAHAIALPSPFYLPSPLSSTARYKLLPASQHNDTIFIYFNPPSILDLKVNTRQRVYFNFTLYRRQPRLNPVFTTTTRTTTKSRTIQVNSAATNQTTDKDHAKLAPRLHDAPMSDETVSASTTTTITTTTTPSSGKNLSPSTSSPTASTASAAVSNSTASTSPPSNVSETVDKKGQKKEETHGSTYWVMIYSDDEAIARPVLTSPNGLAAARDDSKGSYILMAVSAGRQHNFSVEARHIGRVTMSVAVVDVNGDRRMPQASYVQAVAASQYPVAAVRGERTADIVFNSSAAAIAIIISFGIGAVTDMDSLKRQLKFPVALIIGFCCQFILMPVMAFGLAMLFPLDKDIRFGLLCVACVPGGGLSHVAVVIADGDTALSLTMNLIAVVAMLGTAPLWIFVLGQYFQADPQAVLNPRMIPIYDFEIWLAATFFAYTAGLIIKRLRPTVADAILMWLIKPFLLLASILYITLGVYINMYVFELVNGYALLGAMLLPLSGCVVGALLAAICRQKYAFVKTIALETSSLNCLIVMVALRFSLKQPDADLAAMIPIWVMFTIPGFFVFLAICNKVKNIVLHFWKNRNNKDNDVQSSSKAYSVSSSVVSPPGTTTLSAPLMPTDGMDDDATISTMSNQKVTVL